MRIDVKKLKDYNIDLEEDVTLITYNSWLKEILYVKNKNNKGRIKLLPGGKYQNIATGEIKPCKKQIENRSQGKESLRKTFRKIRKAINVNCEDVRKCKMITLTYKDNMTDTKKFDKDVNLFVKNFNYKYGKSENIKVCEPQARGSFHAHIIFIWEDIAPYIDYNDIIKMWGKGYVKVSPLYGNIEDLGAYFTAHLSDLPVEECNITYEDVCKKKLWVKEVCLDAETGKELKSPKYYVKGARLDLYPPNFRIFRPSRGLKKPTKEEMKHREALKKVDSDKPTFESAIQVLDSDGNVLNVIVRKYYNSRRIPREEDKEPELVYNIFDDIVSS